VPLVGIPITVGRTYDSLEKDRVGDFGNGWSLSIGSPRLEIDPDHNVTMTLQDGKRITFYFTPHQYAYYPIASSAYTAEPGEYGTLTDNGCWFYIQPDALGHLDCYPWDGLSYFNPDRFTYTDPYGRVYTFFHQRNLTTLDDEKIVTIQDLNGNVVRIAPDGITSNLESLNIPITRDTLGRITQIMAPDGNIYIYQYDANGNLSEVDFPSLGTPIKVIYNYADSTFPHLFQSMLDPRGNLGITTTFYDDGRLKTETDAVHNTFTYSYDIMGHTTTLLNPDGGITSTQYDSYGSVSIQTDPMGRVFSNTYDVQHNLLTQTNTSLNETTSYSYDAKGHRTGVTNPLKKTMSAGYNQYGGPVALEDAKGNNFTITYDPDTYMPLNIANSAGTRLGSAVWDSHGSLLKLTDALGKQTTYTYDVYGNVQSATTANRDIATYQYDTLGRRTQVTDFNHNTTNYTYDPFGHTLKIIAPLGKLIQYQYDANGNQTVVIDANGNRTENTYDSANHLITVKHPDGTLLQYTYDWRGNVSLEDHAGLKTNYMYNKDGELTDVTVGYGTADAATTHYEYDAAGRKIKMVDARQNATTYSYDHAGQLIGVFAPDGHSCCI
jgi:YD repeat-containing protein